MNYDEWEKLRKSNLELSFETANWSTVDVLAKWLRKDLGARITNTATGPDARTIFFQLPTGAKITIYQLDTGDVTILGSFAAKTEMDRIADHCDVRVIDPRKDGSS